MLDINFVISEKNKDSYNGKSQQSNKPFQENWQFCDRLLFRMTVSLVYEIQRHIMMNGKYFKHDFLLDCPFN